MPMIMLGTLILAFGWFGFNAGSTLAGTSGRLGIIVVNTLLAGGTATVVSACYMWKVYAKPDPSMMCNGMLGGLVSITAPCAFISPMAAFFIGAFAGLLVTVSVLQFERRGIDDPVGAISVHAICGFWGLISVGLFADGAWGDGYNGVHGNVVGLLYSNHSAKQLLAQLIAAGVCIAWTGLLTAIVFTIIGRAIGGNRVSPEVEIAGLDIPEMGTPGYPEFVTNVGHEAIGTAEIETPGGRMGIT
jgi:Amt family ammonium transporter